MATTLWHLLNRDRHNEGVSRRNRARRTEALARLGGVCVECGTTERLHFDHIDPATKTREMGTVWGCSEEIREEELAKCQLLCASHHGKKSAGERQQFRLTRPE